MSNVINVNHTTTLLTTLLSEPILLGFMLMVTSVILIIVIMKFKRIALGPVILEAPASQKIAEPNSIPSEDGQIVENAKSKFEELWRPIMSHCKAVLKQNVMPKLVHERDGCIFSDNVDYVLDYKCWRIFKKRLYDNHFSKMTPEEIRQDIEFLINQIESEFVDRFTPRLHYVENLDLRTDFKIDKLYDKIEYAIKMLKKYKTDLVEQSGLDYHYVSKELRRLETSQIVLNVRNKS